MHFVIFTIVLWKQVLLFSFTDFFKKMMGEGKWHAGSHTECPKKAFIQTLLQGLSYQSTRREGAPLNLSSTFVPLLCLPLFCIITPLI